MILSASCLLLEDHGNVRALDDVSDGTLRLLRALASGARREKHELLRLVWNIGSYSPEHCTMVPVDDRTLTHSTGWTQETGQTGQFLGTISLSTTKGKTLTLAGVHAKQLGLLAIGCPGCGKVSFTFAGKTWIADLNQVAGTYVFQTTPYSSIKTGTLTIKIISTSTSAHKVQIDGLVLLIKGAFPPSPPPSVHVVAARQV